MAKNYIISCQHTDVKHTGNIRGAKTKALKIANEKSNIAWIYVESNERTIYQWVLVDNVYPAE